jgi:HEAT repeat protein
MKRNTMILTALLAAVLALTLTAGADTQKRSLKALIVTGQNNHDWKLSSPILEKILENSGIFSVDIATSPAEGAGGMADFKPDFAAYNVVVLDYSGEPWCEETKTAFVKYVAEGGGVVVYHAANNSFPEWPEYNRITGLGGWGGRDEKSGPYVRWRDGEVIRDNSPGPGGSHGKAHDFQVIVRDPKHPITKGLPEKWMHALDELYHGLRGPAENLTLLATAYSAPETGGTGEHEPILFTIDYGKGRVFQAVLGHAGGATPPPPMQCAGFIVTLLRGAEWAATGKVTQRVPYDFPAENQVRLWKEFRPVSFKELLSRLAGYEYNQSLETMVDLEETLRSVSAAGKSLVSYEKDLNELLKSNATSDAKLFACKKLSEIGSSTSVPLLAKMLADPQTSYMARYALERIPGAASTDALRNALSTTLGTEKAGVITSLGVRKDRKSVPALAVLASSTDPQMAGAAVGALAQIADEPSVIALAMIREQAAGDFRVAVVDACLQCAEALLAQGRILAAEDLYQALLRPAESGPVRCAAIRGLARAAGPRAGAILLDALKGGDPEMQSAAIGAIPLLSGEGAVAVLAKELPNLAPAAQVQLLAALVVKGDRAALPAVMAAAENSDTPVVEPGTLKREQHTVVAAVEDSDASVRMAALEALGALGDGSTVLLLAQKAAAPTEDAAAARASLQRLHGADVEEALVASLTQMPNAQVKVLLMQTIAERKLTAAGPALLQLARDPDASVRAEAILALRTAAAPALMPDLVSLLLGAAPEGRPELENTVAAVAQSIPDENTRAATVLDALGKCSEPGARKSLVNVLGKIGDQAALPVLEAALTDATPEVRTAAIEALSQWPDETPRSVLLDLAKQAANTPDGALALAGCVRLIALPSERSAEETVKLYEETLSLAADAAQKELVISGLAGTKNAAALPLIYGRLQDPDDAVKTSAIKALSDWPDGAPLPELRAVAQAAANETHKVLALRGFVRLIGLDAARPAEESAALYQEAMTLAPNPEVQKGVLSGLSGTGNVAGLRIAAGCLDSEALREEAEVAVVKIAKGVAASYPQEVKAILSKVLEKAQIDFVRTEATALLDSIRQVEEYVVAWEVAGPYEKPQASGEKLFDEVFPPETADAARVTWQPIVPGTNKNQPFLMELDKMFQGNNRVAYLRTKVWSEQAREAILEMGSDDGLRVWLNGQEVHANNAVRPCRPGEDVVKVSLQQGWNPLLVKVTQGGGEWSFCARFRKVDGTALDQPLRVEAGPVPGS